MLLSETHFVPLVQRSADAIPPAAASNPRCPVMKTLTWVLMMLASLGGPGMFLVGILDSSFLFLPFGNDLLMLSLAARHPTKLAWFAVCASLGSVAGSLVVDSIARKGGEEGLSRFLPEHRIEYVKQKIRKKAGAALATAALLPPPFPFTPFVAAAAAFQYPRWQLIAVLLSARMLRFSIIGILAVSFGQRILHLAKLPAVQYGLIGLLAICLIGSVFSILKWVRKSRKLQPA